MEKAKKCFRPYSVVFLLTFLFCVQLVPGFSPTSAPFEVKCPVYAGFVFFQSLCSSLVPSLDGLDDLGWNVQNLVDFFLLRFRGPCFSYSQNHPV